MNFSSLWGKITGLFSSHFSDSLTTIGIIVGLLFATVIFFIQKKSSEKTEKKVLDAIKEKGINEEEAKLLKDKYDITLRTIAAVLNQLGEVVADDDQITLLKRLEEKLQEYAKFKEEIKNFHSDHPKVNKLREAAKRALDDGQFKNAEIFFQQALDIDLTAIHNQDAISLEFEENKRTRQVSAAQSCAGIAEAAKLQTTPTSYKKAAQHYEQASVLVQAISLEDSYRYRISQGLALYSCGFEFGDNKALKAAINTYKNILKEIDIDAYRDMSSHIINLLGNALLKLGQRCCGTELLQEAADNFDQARKMRPKESMPKEWASTTNNLGIALLNIGLRSPNMSLLYYAVKIFKEALCIRTKDAFPKDWAATSNNLGCALLEIGDKEIPTINLEKSIAILNEVLTVRTENDMPFAWAETQGNLGNALLYLWRKNNDFSLLDKAINAYEKALRVCTKKRFPLQWAGTVDNLGIALFYVGFKENDTARLKKAIECFDDALKVFTPTDMPSNWASTKNNIGNALLHIGIIEDNINILQEAVESYLQALKIRTPKDMPFDWALTESNLGDAYRAIGSITNDRGFLKKACSAYKDALNIFSPKESKPQYMRTSSQLNDTIQLLKDMNYVDEIAKTETPSVEEDRSIQRHDEGDSQQPEP